MAARLELFSVAPGTRADTVDEAALDVAALTFGRPTAAITCVGWVSADDRDEERLVELLEAAADASGVFDAHIEGSGVVAWSDVEGLAARLADLALDGGLERSWRDALAGGVAAAATAGRAVAWRMTYDPGGSTDAGREEFPTAWSGPPTEGDPAGTP